MPFSEVSGHSSAEGASMEGRVNYLAVGIFVFLFLAGIFSFAFWLMKYSQYEEMHRYVVYFDESVAGLSKDASVKYMGVDAGVVEDIHVAPHNTQQVAVYLKIRDDIAIKKDMQATLKFYGLTGLAYVEIFGHDPHAPLLQPKEDEVPVIRSAPSIYARLDETLAKLTQQFSTTLTRVDTLLNDDNLRSIHDSLANVASVTDVLSKNRNDIATILKRGISLEKRLGETLTKTGRETTRTLKTFRRTLQQVQRSLKRGDYNLKEISRPTLRHIDMLIEKLDILTDEMDTTIRHVRQSPADLLFKRTIPQPGPGE